MKRGSGTENIYFDSGKLRSEITYFRGVKTKEVKYNKNGSIEKVISFI